MHKLRFSYFTQYALCLKRTDVFINMGSRELFYSFKEPVKWFLTVTPGSSTAMNYSHTFSLHRERLLFQETV